MPRLKQVIHPDEEPFEFPSDLELRGAGRDAQDPRFISLAFSRELNDQELRALHDGLRSIFNG
jgi:hypothetical protein